MSLVVFFAVASPVVAQNQETDKPENTDEMSLEELMNITINSASKKDETLFDAPVSSYTITRAEIEKAGSTTIMEALRLAPGVIVREQTNGNYDIHIRGFDNILRRPNDYSKQNLITLLMIDNRPVFNYSNGGTFWETLPIDLNDVERIEVVRGPSAPMFGPNAVSGVINIITRKADAPMATAHVQGGTQGTLIAQTLAGNSSKKWRYQASINYQQRDRFDDDYYQTSTASFVDGNTLASDNFSTWYPDPKLAMRKWGANAALGYEPNSDASIELTVGTQASEVQRNYLGFNDAKLNTMTNTSYYANLAAAWHGLHVRASSLRSKENLNYNRRPNEDYAYVEDIVAEYRIQVTNHIQVTPGVSYNYVQIDDTDFMEDGDNKMAGFINGKASMHDTAGYIRTDLSLTNAWRVLAALRVDKFSTHDDPYFAYEFATTYKLTKQHLVRFVASRSNSGSFIGNNFLNLQIPVGPTTRLVFSGRKNLDLFTINMLEVGYRAQVSKYFQLDVDIFRQVGDQFSTVLVESQLARTFHNVPTSAEQIGATLSLNVVATEKLQIKPFVTFQSTKTKDLPSSYATAAADPTLTYSDGTHKSTPSVYGGYFVNYKASTKINVNLNGYYFSAHQQYDISDPTETANAGHIAGKFLLNARVSYAVCGSINLAINGRNILNQDSREFFGTDHTGAQLFGSISFNVN